MNFPSSQPNQPHLNKVYIKLGGEGQEGAEQAAGGSRTSCRREQNKLQEGGRTSCSQPDRKHFKKFAGPEFWPAQFCGKVCKSQHMKFATKVRREKSQFTTFQPYCNIPQDTLPNCTIPNNIQHFCISFFTLTIYISGALGTCWADQKMNI